MIAQLSRLPQFLWNLIALFFAGWLAVAGWLLCDGDNSSIVRFAFAFCGSLALFAGFAGKGLCVLTRFAKRFSGVITSLLLIVVLAAIFEPVFDAGYEKARISSSVSFLKQSRLAIHRYADSNGGVFPTRLDWATVEPLACAWSDSSGTNTPCGIDSASREPYVWRRVLGGLRVSDIKSPANVIVAYSQPYEFRLHPLGRTVLFLDGHVRWYTNDGFWRMWSEQPPLPKKPKHNAVKRSIERTP